MQIRNVKYFTIFNDMIAGMRSNKKLNPKVIELFIRDRKLKIFLFLSQNLILLFQKNRLNSTHYFYYENSKQTRASTNHI